MFLWYNAHMNKFHEMTVAGVTRRLPICKVNDRMSIAAFIMFGDVEMTIACAKELLKGCPAFDVLLCPEAKGIPLCYEMSRQSGKTYFVARKTVKVYMPDPVAATVKSITTLSVQNLYLDRSELNAMRSKKVLIVDDVISTGETLSALEQLLKDSGAIVCGKAAVLAEGGAAARDDIIFLEKLPLCIRKVTSFS